MSSVKTKAHHNDKASPNGVNSSAHINQQSTYNISSTDQTSFISPEFALTSVSGLQMLQRTAGNQAVGRLIQAKLSVGKPNDKYEQEADRAADQVMRKPIEGEAEYEKGDDLVQKISSFPASSVNIDNTGTSSLEKQIRTPGSGQPLPENIRNKMESRLGADFSNVRIHSTVDDRKVAENLNAIAFTHNNHIWLGEGSSAKDCRLMAHELTHVIQQGAAGPDTNELRRKAPDQSQTEISDSAEIKDKTINREKTPENDNQNSVLSSNNNKPFSYQSLSEPENSINKTSFNALSLNDKANQGHDSSSSVDYTFAVNSSLPDIDFNNDDIPHHNLQSSIPDSSVSFSANLVTSIPAATDLRSLDGNISEDLPIENEPAFLDDNNFSIPSITDGNTEAEGSAPSIQRSPAENIGQRIIGFFQGIGTTITDVGSGVLNGIKDRVSGLVTGIQNGWGSLLNIANGTFDTIGSQFSGLIQRLTGFASSSFSSVQNVWQSLYTQAQTLTGELTNTLGSVIAPVFSASNALASAIARLDTSAVQVQWNRISEILNNVKQSLSSAARNVTVRVAGIWQTLSNRFRILTDNIGTQTQEIFTRLQTSISMVWTRISSFWNSVQENAGNLLSYISIIPNSIQSLIGQLAGWIQQFWQNIKTRWELLHLQIQTFFDSVQQWISSIYNKLIEKFNQLWAWLQSQYNNISQFIQAQVQRLTNGLFSICESIRNISIADLISKVAGLATLLRLGRQIFTNFKGFITPLARSVTDKVYSEMPQAALTYAHQQLSKAGITAKGSGPIETILGNEQSFGSEDLIVQRLPRSTATDYEIGGGVLNAVSAIWSGLSRGVFLKMALDILLEQLFPPIAIYREISALIQEDLRNMHNGLYLPRNFFRDPIGALHDLYTSLYHLIVDTIMSLLRRIMNILMSFMFWITVILTVIGAVGGSAVVGILGGILAALATIGIGAGAGAAGGAAAGGAAGAGIGFSTSLLINEVIFFGFLIVQGASIVMILADLKTTLQTDDDKKRDYLQLAQSIIAVGVGIALMALAWLAGLLAKGVASLLRGLTSKFKLPPWFSRFFRGARSVRKQPPGSKPTEIIANELAAEERLARIIGGDLAHMMVSELGPQAAEQVVQNLGKEVVLNLNQDLTPTAIKTIADNLNRVAVERLLNANLTPSRIYIAVNEGHAIFIENIAPEQIARLAGLSDKGFSRIIKLSDADLSSLLSSPKISDVAQLDALLNNPKIRADQLSILISNNKIADGFQLKQILDRYQSGDQLSVLLDSGDVASGADLLRLADVLHNAGVTNATTGGMSNGALVRFANRTALSELEATAIMQSQGKITGLADWIRFVATEKNSVDDVVRTIGELREARRLANDNPGRVIDVSGDMNAPVRPGTTEKMESFDLTLRDPAGNVVQSVEVTTVDSPVSQTFQLTPGVRHAANKAANRIAEGNPIPGDLVASIRMELDIGVHPRGSQNVEVLTDGTINLRRADTGAIIRSSNLYNDFTTNVGRIQNNHLLTYINLVDPATGKILAAYERVGGRWVRVQ